MPGYIIHLTEAGMINQILKEQNIVEYSAEWEKSFFYGALLPDAVKKGKKGISHFWKEISSNQITNVPDMDTFLRKYRVSKQEPLKLGYLAHLHLDKVFWQEYIRQNVSFLDSNESVTDCIYGFKYVFINKMQKCVMPEMFFSEKYLYGDYTKLNYVLMRKYQLQIPVFDQKYSGMIKEADNYEMKNLLQKLNRYLMKEDYDDCDLKVFKQKDLERFLKDTAVSFTQQYT